MSFLNSWRSGRTLKQKRIPDDLWWQIVRERPLFNGLSSEELDRLRNMAEVFLGKKAVNGAAGQVIDESVRLVIAVQACLPILNLGIHYYNGWVEIVVYPERFVPLREYVDNAGVVHQTRDPLAGESWLGGPLILSWADANYIDDGAGVNVVIHEFSHKLDMLNGGADGYPPLHRGMQRQSWANAFLTAYNDFCRRIDDNEETVIDSYAAENPAEFFAVLSETFFEIPAVLKNEYPEVYRQLGLFYRQDPLRRRLLPIFWQR